MKLLFIHGAEKFKEDKDGNLYTDGSYNQQVWLRYEEISTSLCVIARKDSLIYEKAYAKEKFNSFDKSKILFIEVPDRNTSIKTYIDISRIILINRIIEEKVLLSDRVIARVPCEYSNIAIKYAKKHKVPYLVEIVACPWNSLWNHSNKAKLFAFSAYWAMKKSVKDAPYAIYVTEHFLQKRYPCKGKTLSCSDVVINVNKTGSQVLKERQLKIKSFPENKPVILGTIAATDVKYKGQKYVIESISILKKEGYDFEYYLAGNGDTSYLRSESEKYNVSEKIKFIGSIPHDEIFDYIDSIHIYIQPSMTEGLPRTIIEAMSRGCPVMGTNVGGIPELVSECFLFRAKDAYYIAEKLKKMTREVMLLESKRSFEKAQEYDKDLLDCKRRGFLNEFMDDII